MSIVELIKKTIALISGKKQVSSRVLALVLRDFLEVDVLLKGDSPSQIKQALIVADRSLDSVLKDLVVGKAMGDRLKNAKNLFHPVTYDKIWQAHKLRNSLVHESGFEAQGFIIKNAVGQIRSGLGELGVKA